jgi:hypothetical protein
MIVAIDRQALGRIFYEPWYSRTSASNKAEGNFRPDLPPCVMVLMAELPLMGVHWHDEKLLAPPCLWKMVSRWAIGAATAADWPPQPTNFFLRSLLFGVLGIGRDIAPIDLFPCGCRRIYDKKLEGCENIWLDHEGRRLYLACSGTNHRLALNPSEQQRRQ